MIVLDSSFLIAYHNARDVHHQSAVRAMERLTAGGWGRALLLEYVFLEVVTVILARLGIEAASTVATALLESREVDFVPCSDIFVEVQETFRGQKGRALSFTDAAIVTVARRRARGLVASFDLDFRDMEGISVVPSANRDLAGSRSPRLG